MCAAHRRHPIAWQVYSRKARAATFVLAERAKLEGELDALCTTAEAEASRKYAAGDAAGGQARLNELAIAVGGKATAAWVATWQALLVKYVDGKVGTPCPSAGR